MSEPVEPKEPKKVKRLSVKEWTAACILWAQGEATLAQLAEKFGVPEDTLKSGFRRRGLKKGEKKAEVESKVKESIERSTADDAALLAKRVRDTKDQIFRINDAFLKLTWKEVLEAAQRGEPIASRHPNIKALGDAAKTVGVLRENLWHALGIANGEDIDPDSVPDLILQVVSDEAIQAEMARKRELESLTGPMPDLGELPAELKPKEEPK